MALVKYNNNSISAVTSTGLTAGAMTLIKEQTASSSATISFVHGTSDVVLDGTYPIYLFKFINIHFATDDTDFRFNVSIDSGSNYNVAKTTTMFRTYHGEDGSSGGVSYSTSEDLAQGTGDAYLNWDVGAASDENVSGEMWLFNPSSTTFVKHFIARTSSVHSGSAELEAYQAGYANTTSAINAVQFKGTSGNIDAGTFKLYGIKDS